jgi:hypothetical protein
MEMCPQPISQPLRGGLVSLRHHYSYALHDSTPLIFNGSGDGSDPKLRSYRARENGGIGAAFVKHTGADRKSATCFGAFEWLGLKLPILLQQDFHFAFCLFEFLPAGTGKLHSFLEQLQRVLERNVALLKFRHDCLQS